MRHLPLVVVISVGALLGGCETVPRPSSQSRQKSGRLAPKLDDRAVFFLYCSEGPLKVTSFSGRGGEFKFNFDHAAPYAGGLATAFTKDGYLITAGHTARAHILVIGVMNGAARVAPARVVYKKSFGLYGTDFAILHVDQSIDFPLPLGRLTPDQDVIYALGADREPTFKIAVLGGKIRSATRSQAGEVMLLDTDLPSWHGDSGGGVVLRDGSLVGVITGFQMKWSALHNAKLVCAPSKDLVESIIAADRTASAAKPE